MISTSGIRGIVGKGLDPIMVTGYSAAFGTHLKKGLVVIGRDTRPTGQMLKMAAIAGLRGVGNDVVDIGIVPTPTVELAVTGLGAKGGICITASHNPSEWNALKFFGNKGEFIDKGTLEKINKIYADGALKFSTYKTSGSLISDNNWIDNHIGQILKLKAVNRNAVKKCGLKIIVDAVNGAGSIALPRLLEELGVEVIRLNCANDGNFVHNPEPIPENLDMLSGAVKKFRADMGMACDPDADRLALVDESGVPIGEELTLALAVKYILSLKPGKVVVNLSTSRVTEDAAIENSSRIYYAPVGEANVVEEMRKRKAVIGGEGNGGVIYPALHHGRDALVAAAIICAALAGSKKSLSSLSGTLPKYYNIKMKAPIPAGFDVRISRIEKTARQSCENLKIDRRDGIRFDFTNGWFQIRKSNTEPIFRLIVETNSMKLSSLIKNEVMSFLK